MSSKKEGGFFESLPVRDKRRLLYGGITLFVLGIGTFLGRRVYLSRKQRHALSRSLGGANPEYFATLIFKSIDGLGTDEDTIYDVFSKMPSQDFYQKVQASYQALYKTSLEDDLNGDLSTSEYERVSAIIRQKPKKTGGTVEPDYSSWSSRLQQAAAGWGTDEAEIYRVLTEVPDAAAMRMLEAKYQSDWGESLDTMLNDELSGDELQKAQSIIAGKT